MKEYPGNDGSCVEEAPWPFLQERREKENPDQEMIAKLVVELDPKRISESTKTLLEKFLFCLKEAGWQKRRIIDFLIFFTDLSEDKGRILRRLEEIEKSLDKK